MKIKSSKKKTRHILVKITPYSPFGEEDEFMEFGFLYFEYTLQIELELRSFHRKYRKSIMKVSRFPIVIFDAILLKSSDIENSDNMNNPDYRYIKYDSFNYLKNSPVFDDCDKYYRIDATMLCFYYYFQIDVERIPDGYRLPYIIYRMGASYTKLVNYSKLKIR